MAPRPINTANPITIRRGAESLRNIVREAEVLLGLPALLFGSVLHVTDSNTLVSAGTLDVGKVYFKLVGFASCGVGSADLAATEPTAFAAVVQKAKDALNGGSGEKQVKRRRAQDSGAGSPPRGDEVEATKAAERRANELDVDLAEVEGSGSEGRVLVEDVEEAGSEVSATDAARSKADELKVDLAAVEGTGANERITVGDVENAAVEEGGKAE